MRFILCLGLLLTVALAPFAAAAENDNNNQRALETAVISPVLDGRPVNGGLAVNPNGYVYNGKIYLFTHMNFMGTWRPSGLVLCKDNGVDQGETLALWRGTATVSGVKQPFQFMGNVSACESVTGAGSHTIGGAPAIGGNGKYYLTGNRTRCTDWNSGCMDAEFLGAVTNPDNPSYAWQLSPILAKSTVGSTTFSFVGFKSLQPFVGAPAPPTSLFPRLSTSVGPATLWGYVGWGLVPGYPSKLAAVQIAEYASTTRPNWSTTKVYVLADDNTWKLVGSGGVLNFIPKDVSSEFSSLSLSSLFYDSTQSSWVGVGHNTAYTLTPDSGCDERTGDWWTNPNSNFYHAAWWTSHSTVYTEVLGSSSTRSFVYSTYTQNTNQIGAWMVDISGYHHVLRGSTERICFDSPGSWWHPWIGAEITVEKVPGS